MELLREIVQVALLSAGGLGLVAALLVKLRRGGDDRGRQSHADSHGVGGRR